MPMFTEEARYVPAAQEVQSRLPAFVVKYSVPPVEYWMGMYAGV